MEAIAITLLTQLGIALPKIIETIFILFVVVFLLTFRAWPRIKIFFEDITLLRKSSGEATELAKQGLKEAVEAKESVRDLTNTVKEYMIHNDIKLQKGTEQFDLLHDITKDMQKEIDSLKGIINTLTTQKGDL